MQNYLENSKIKKKIESALKYFGITSDIKKINQSINYLMLLKKWNKVYNMTSILKFDDMLVKHLFDSLSIVPFLKGKSIVDVGTGGGFPGLPLSIFLPEKHFTLIDKVRKKILFLKHAQRVLNIRNISLLNIRVEEYFFEDKFDQVISRAFCSISSLCFLCRNLITKNGEFILMLGKILNLNYLNNLPIIFQIHKIKVPFLIADRHVITFRII